MTSTGGIPTVLSARRRWTVLVICASALFLVGLDTTIVTVGLPQIGAGLDVDGRQLAWVVDAFTIPFASLLITSGALADRFGRRRVLQIGLVVVGLSSLACAAAPSAQWLIAARILQGAGASMLTPVALAIVVSMMPDPRERARAIGIWASMFGLSLAAGPVTGGALIAAFDWRAVFWINTPLTLAAVLLVAALVPESRADRIRSLDPVGQVLLVLMVVMTVGLLIEGPRADWTLADWTPAVWTPAVSIAADWTPAVSIAAVWIAALGALALLLLGFVRAESRRREPLIDPALFREAGFAAAVLAAIAVFIAFSMTLLLTTLLLQHGQGWTPLAAGATTLPMAVGVLVTAPVAGHLVGTTGPRMPLIVAGACLAVGGVLLVRLAVGMSLPILLAAFLLVGAGVGLSSPPITNTAVSSLPRERAGVAGGITSTARQVGTALGVAIASGLMAFLPADDTARPTAAALPGGILVVVCGATVLLLGVLAPAPPRPCPARGARG